MEEHKNKYALVVNRQRVSVTKEVYNAYYHCRDREKYLDKLSSENNISLESCMEKGISVEYAVASMEDSIDEGIATKEMIAKMLECFALLDDQDRQLIIELFYRGKSERALSVETGIPPMTIHNRKRRILNQMKKLMKI